MAEDQNFEEAYSKLQQMEVALRPFAAISHVLHAAMAAKRALPTLEAERQRAAERTEDAKRELATMQAHLVAKRQECDEELAKLDGGLKAKQQEARAFEREVAARDRKAEEGRAVQEAEWAGRLSGLRLEEKQLQDQVSSASQKLKSLREEARQLAS